ncbi:MAG: response regulator [Nitrospira defluvii]|nr:response regulator [Nitrospira defluvii]
MMKVWQNGAIATSDWLPRLILVMAGLPLIVGGIILWYVETRLITDAGQSLATAATEIASKLDMVLRERINNVELLSHAQVLRTQNREEIQPVLRALQEVSPEYSWVALTDAQGRVTVSTQDSLVGNDFSRDPGFLALRGGARTAVDDAVMSPEDNGVFVVTVMARVEGPGGEWRGGLIARIGMPAFEDVFAQTVMALQTLWGATVHLEYQFLNSRGDLIADSFLREEGQHNLQQIGVPSARLVESGPSGFVEEWFPRRQTTVITGYARTRGQNEGGQLHWGILVRVDRHDILGPILTTIFVIGLAGSIVIVPLIGVLLWSTVSLKRAWLQTQREQNRALAAEARFLKVLDAAPNAFVMTDGTERIVYANRVVEGIFGYRPDELLGRPVEVLMPERYRQHHPAHRGHYLAAPHTRPMGGNADLVAQHRDGHEFPVLISLSHVEMEDGIYVLSAIRDISQLKQVQEERERLHRHIRLLLDSTAEGLYGIDHEGRCTFVNPAGAELLGYRPEELLGQPMHRLIHHSRTDGSPCPEEQCALEKVRLSGEGSRLDDDSFWRKNHTIFSAEIDARPMYEAGRLTGAVVAFTDITERKHTELALATAAAILKERNTELLEARDQALAATKAKSDFLASMSHEIRTPMNAIIGMADLLKETTLTADQMDYVDRFTRAANALLDLINGILDLSKIEAGHLDLETIPFGLCEVVESTAELLAGRAHAKGLELVAHVAPEVPTWVGGDPTRLRQILINLVGNAIKFTERGGVTVDVRPDPTPGDPACLHFTVTDTGIGIPENKVQAIFENFTQVDSSTTRKYGGTGLGLGISKRLVEMMGGAIWVESRLGLGSTFHFTMRLPACQASESSPDTPRLPLSALAGRRILVVDDHETNRLVVREHLSRLEAEVHEAPDGASALQMLQQATAREQRYDLVVLDGRMPGMDGFQLARALKADVQLSAVPAIMLTSEARLPDTQHLEDAGLRACLAKPIRRAPLLNAVLRAIETKHATDLPLPVARPEALSPEGTGPLRILLVEDLEDNRLVIALFLKDMPYSVEMAEDGLQAVEKFTMNRYDLVLMDIQMPQMDGYAATAAIRQWETEEHRAPTPIVALTANAFQEELDKSLAAGCTAHLTKPIKKKTLLEAIRQYARVNPRKEAA